MSAFAFGFVRNLLDILNDISKPYRAVGSIVPDVTVREMLDDRLVITEHPVEQGAAITDHAYKVPARVVVEYGFSLSSPQAGGNTSYLNQVYGQILQLQISRQPFVVYTGRRAYSNMMLEAVDLPIDQDTENRMLVRLTCREVLIVGTSTVQVPTAAANMTQPQNTAPVTDRGTLQLGGAPNFNSPTVSV